MDIKEIKGIIDLMRKNSLSEFEYEKDGTKIRIRRGPDGEPQVFASSPYRDWETDRKSVV